MISNDLEKDPANVCDLRYLSEMMGNKNNLIIGIIEAFLIQVPEELNGINAAIVKMDYAVVKALTHTMKSSISIMGITLLTPILKEMEDLGTSGTNMEKIKELSLGLNVICLRAFKEIENEKHNYV